MPPTKIFKTWNEEENATWRALAHRQHPHLKTRASRLWLEGFQKLNFTLHEVPDFDQMNLLFNTVTGWNLIPTSQVFADGETWFQLLKNKQMILSDYIRPFTSLDYTPLPDVFHDAFGHLPFFADPHFRKVITLMTQRILAAEPKERAALGHIWWYTIEFGLIKEKGEVRALGAGLISSCAELNRVFTDQVKIQSFDPTIVSQTPESHHDFHPTLFVLDSLEQLEDIAQNWSLQ